MPLSAIADSGLPSQVKAGPLKQAAVKQLMQYFEDHVAEAFAAGDSKALENYLAGPMLQGNVATINVLNQRQQRNIYKINVGSVSIDNNETNRVVFDMTGSMVTDYYLDTATNQPVADNLPGPSSIDFLVFFDRNPANHTWYWTGEQNLADSSGGGSNGGTG